MMSQTIKWKIFLITVLLIASSLFLPIIASAVIDVGGTVDCPGGDCSQSNRTIIDFPVTGCMDSRASNYNSRATIDGPCTYNIAAPSNLVAEYDTGTKSIRLTWQNNRSAVVGYQYTRVVQGGFGSSPDNGTHVYQGSSQTTSHNGFFVAGQTYIYLAFNRGINGEWSGPAVTTVTVPTSPDEPIAPEDKGKLPSDEGGGRDVFSSYPSSSSTNPLVQSLSLQSFIFRQPRLGDKTFNRAGQVRINGDRNLTIFLPYGAVPEVLKTIGVAITDPDNSRLASSYVLRLRPDGQGYEVTLAPLKRSGTYPINIYLINFEDQTIKHLSGRLLVTSSFLTDTQLIASTFARDVGLPVSIGAGVTAGFLQILFAATRVESFYDLWLIALRFFSLLLGYLGFRRRVEPWGVVYDAVTKRPIDPAYVTVRAGSGKEAASAITDIDGRFGFYLPVGTYELTAGKTHYIFPSQTLAGQDNDGIYDNLYFGQPFAVGEGEVVRKNIPLDPAGFDWNEFIKNKVNFFRVHSKREWWRVKVMSVLYWLGFCFALGYVIFDPNWLDIFIVGTYLLLAAVELFVKRRFRVSRVRRASGEPLSFAVVKFFLPGINQLVKSVVADAYGRLYALTSPGTYYYTIEEKEADGSYREVYRSGEVVMPKGVLTGDLVVA